MCGGVFALLASVDFRLQIITTAGGVSRIKITFRILKNGRAQQYMQVSITPPKFEYPHLPCIGFRKHHEVVNKVLSGITIDLRFACLL